MKRSLIFLDESGFMLHPVVRRTWAPRGQTPIQKSWDRHDRLSVIAAIILPPQRERHRLRCFFRVHGRNITAQQIVDFLGAMVRQVRGSLIVVMDRWSVHRAANVRAWLARQRGRVRLEWLPAYAPELNPAEGLWNHSKYADLANFIPDDARHLRRAVRRSLTDQRHRPNLLASFFDHAGLPL